MSSPHLGSRRPESGGIIKKTWRFLVHGVVRMLYSQTGKELLYEEPNLETKDQLLCQLSDPSTYIQLFRNLIEKFAAFLLPSKMSLPISDQLEAFMNSARGCCTNYYRTGKEYYKQLERFRYRTLIGIAHYDNIVPFCSAVICNVNPYEIPAK
jgi:hypothetical protein